MAAKQVKQNAIAVKRKAKIAAKLANSRNDNQQQVSSKRRNTKVSSTTEIEEQQHILPT
ncbi:hypothetical protein JCGZ_00755 [Jatropha curcas]|uniref:Uncharacterized protein n=1 Tax=Jatropha curcas TaxID=180498 RepID=A0A067KVH4_JATCU|nr:hypothetical protein JCGZ_00755 [Jatropha curcas]